MAISAFSLLFILQILITTASSTLTCTAIYAQLHPCYSYLITGVTTHNHSVPTPCCNGLKSLNATATTTAARQTLCKCIEHATSTATFTIYNLKLAAELPSKCGVRIAFQIIPVTDCNKIK